MTLFVNQGMPAQGGGKLAREVNLAAVGLIQPPAQIPVARGEALDPPNLDLNRPTQPIENFGDGWPPLHGLARSARKTASNRRGRGKRQ